jgi:hypothetical protein
MRARRAAPDAAILAGRAFKAPLVLAIAEHPTPIAKELVWPL